MFQGENHDGNAARNGSHFKLNPASKFFKFADIRNQPFNAKLFIATNGKMDVTKHFLVHNALAVKF